MGSLSLIKFWRIMESLPLIRISSCHLLSIENCCIQLRASYISNVFSFSQCHTCDVITLTTACRIEYGYPIGDQCSGRILYATSCNIRNVSHNLIMEHVTHFHVLLLGVFSRGTRRCCLVRTCFASSSVKNIKNHWLQRTITKNSSTNLIPPLP